MHKARTLTAIAAFTGLILSAGSPARASAVSCGDTLTAHTQLDSDLVCSGTALIIGADGITVDLKGHSLTGNGTGIGIDNTAGYDYVTIKNGVIEGFGYGVFLTNASYNELKHLTVRQSVNSTGVEGAGILLWLANDHNKISHNKIYDNERHGLYLGCNPYAFSGNFSDCDFKHATENVIEHNKIANNGQDGFDSYGIQLQAADGNIVRHNKITGHSNWYYLGNAYFGQAIYVLSSSSNLIEHNLGGSNTFGTVLWDNGFVGTADGNVYSKNDFNDNGDAGMRLYGGTTGTVVEGNHADRNGFGVGLVFNVKDGINASGVGVTLIKNHARNNSDLGIQASGGVIDGGKNKAGGNGNPLQCTGVVCQ